MAKLTLDELLSNAQLFLRDGYRDHLSRAVADARNRIRELEGEVARLEGRWRGWKGGIWLKVTDGKCPECEHTLPEHHPNCPVGRCAGEWLT